MSIYNNFKVEKKKKDILENFKETWKNSGKSRNILFEAILQK